MGKTDRPRSGSMQFWPRKRAKRLTPRVRSWNPNKEGFLGFAGYKAGMTHLMVLDQRKNTMSKDEDIFVPVTIMECPPMRIASIRCYISEKHGERLTKEIFLKTESNFSLKANPSKPQDPSVLDCISKSLENGSLIRLKYPEFIFLNPEKLYLTRTKFFKRM